MAKYSRKEYKFVKFEKSDRKGKKYNAVLENRETKRQVKVPFGAIKSDGIPYPQYRDTTGLGLYSKYDTMDKNRRRLYRQRHSKEKPSFREFYSAAVFSWRFLW
jgi:hypothetical protein